MKKSDMDSGARKKLIVKMFLFFTLGFAMIGVMLFGPAGSFDFWQAWLFLVTLMAPCVFVVVYFLKRDPQLLERRMRYREKVTEQKNIIAITDVFCFIGFLIPGFDHRYGWSPVPGWLSIVSAMVMFLGYLLIFFVFKENSYTSRIIEVEPGQKLISTGPYAVVRHPMYVGALLMFLVMPLVLGSWWALAAFIPVVPLVMLRAVNEEKVLSKELKGYGDYIKKVKYRFIPGIW